MNLFWAGDQGTTQPKCVHTAWHFVAGTQASGATSIFITRTPLWMPMVVMPAGCVLLTWSMATATLRASVLAIWPDAPVRAQDHAAEDFL